MTDNNSTAQQEGLNTVLIYIQTASMIDNLIKSTIHDILDKVHLIKGSFATICRQMIDHMII